MLLRVLDFETSGIKADNHPAQIIEYGWQDVRFVREDDGTERGFLDGHAQGMVAAKIPVDIEARAIHHITDEEIAAGIPLEHAMAKLSEGSPDVFVAHNATFEQQFFTGAGKPWICTWKCAMRLWPDAPGFSNQVLRYWLGLAVDPQAAFPPHRALPDAYVTAHILLEMLAAGKSVEDMIKVSILPPMPKRISFGKHKGAEWASLPTDYLEWIVKKSDMDADVKWLAKRHLEQAE